MSYSAIPMLNTTGYSGYGAFGVDAGAITTGKYCGSASNIQAALNDLGYGPLAVDGNLGQKSYAAMDKFGRAVGVGAVQYATPAFCAALQKALAAAQAPPPDAGPPPQGQPPQGQPPAQYPPPQGQPPAQYPPPQGQPPGGGGATGITGWWQSQTPTMKYVMIGGGALLLAGIVAAIVMSGEEPGLKAAPAKLAANKRRNRSWRKKPPKMIRELGKLIASFDDEPRKKPKRRPSVASQWFRSEERKKRKSTKLKRNRSRSKKAEKWAWKHAGRKLTHGTAMKARIYEVMRRGGVDMTTATNLLHTVPYRDVDMAVSLARGRSRTQAKKSIALGRARRRAKYVLEEAKRATKKRRTR